VVPALAEGGRRLLIALPLGRFGDLAFCAITQKARMSTVTQLSLAVEQLVTKQQLAEHLGRSTRWVELRVRDGMPSEAPTSRFPRRRFRLSEVEAWLASGKPKPATPQAQRIAVLEERVAELAATLEQLKQRRV
jgi:hypothetical protein